MAVKGHTNYPTDPTVSCRIRARDGPNGPRDALTVGGSGRVWVTSTACCRYDATWVDHNRYKTIMGALQTAR